MVHESDLTYTQHITTCNTYLNCIHILQPIENYRRVTDRYFGQLIFLRQKFSDQFSISVWSTNRICNIHNISQHVMVISTSWKLSVALLIVISENESESIYTQYIKTSNTYVNCIHILRPCENYRPITDRYFAEIIVVRQKFWDKLSISQFSTNLIWHIHNISQHIIVITTASTFYRKLEIMFPLLNLVSDKQL